MGSSCCSSAPSPQVSLLPALAFLRPRSAPFPLQCYLSLARPLYIQRLSVQLLKRACFIAQLEFTHLQEPT